MIEAFPEHPWLKAHLDDADLLARAGTWKPFTVLELGKVMSDPTLRLVGSERDLLIVLQESLGRLGQELHGEIPTARFLWNMYDSSCRPKEEEDLSDFITTHLRSDIGAHGIVVNREVQIRRANPNGQAGQRTDIQVSASSSSSATPVVTVIVEIKGCWNAALKVAMRTQLRDRYLKDNLTQTGIYVTGWYASAAWDVADSRRQGCGKANLSELRAELDRQATDLSIGAHLSSVVLDCSLD
jgi:hypothetical protein